MLWRIKLCFWISNMEKLLMCRICLVENVRMFEVLDSKLQELYEKLTNIPFVTEDRRPMLACYFCYAKLKRCCQLKRKCLETKEGFSQMMNEPNLLRNRGQLQFSSGFTRTPIENINIVDLGHESTAVKDESPADGLDDIIQPKEEHQSDDQELGPDVEETESDPDGWPVMEFKVEEEQEVPRNERRASVRKNKSLRDTRSGKCGITPTTSNKKWDVTSRRNLKSRINPALIDEWNTPGTSSRPTVVPPLPPTPQPSALRPLPAPVQTQWQPPKKKKKPEDTVLKIFKECERNAREYERERDRIAQDLERERIRQRDVQLQLQAQWLDFMKEALQLLKSYLEKRSE